MTQKNVFVFGPVWSRRLGRSLGVDLIPLKTCTQNCIFCQLGITNNLTAERKEYVPLDEVVEQIKEKLQNTNPDYISFAGSGEPLLYSGIEKLIDEIKKMTNIPVALFTNGNLLYQDEARKQIMKADLIIPSLNACDEESFQRINRAHSSINFEKHLQGLRKLSEEFKGRIWLEIFIA